MAKDLKAPHPGQARREEAQNVARDEEGGDVDDADRRVVAARDGRGLPWNISRAFQDALDVNLVVQVHDPTDKGSPAREEGDLPRGHHDPAAAGLLLAAPAPLSLLLVPAPQAQVKTRLNFAELELIVC